MRDIRWPKRDDDKPMEAAQVAKIYDVSMPITLDMPVYKNKPEKRPNFEVTSDHPADGDGVRETRMCIDLHTGTHIDAPLHMMKNGRTIDTIAIEQLYRPCRVVDLSHVAGGITRQDLEPLKIATDEFLIVRTRNSTDKAFNPEFVYVAEDGARYLADIGVAGIAVDGLGVERSQPNHQTHKLLFAADAVIIEGLQLAGVPEGRYMLVALPLRLVGLDAAPARVLLLG